MKVEECKEEVAKLHQTGLKAGLISQDEFDTALKLTSWPQLQPVLDRTQGIQENKDDLKLARAERPLMREDFTRDELEKLKALAPEEFELLK